ncbi:MAG: hypothetical protein ISN29_10545 [Gammaproteobacteria bacterium AqS3]|nr:hypothetical protein [Gammaproteobacteria bacterium AqS3]
MTDQETETHVKDPFNEIRNSGPIIVCIDDLIKSRPGARVKSEPRPDERRKPKSEKPNG